MIQRVWLEGGNGTFMAHSFQQTTPALLNLAIFFEDFGEMGAEDIDWIKELESGCITGNQSCLCVEDNIFIITNEYIHAIPPFHIRREVLINLVEVWKGIYGQYPDRIDLTQEGDKFTFVYDTSEGHQTIVIE